MVTIYELLEVSENATKEEITESYQNLVLEFRQDPSFSEQVNKENEMILNKIKIAYEILIDDNKRKRYDEELAKKRAENLLESVVTSEEKFNNSVIQEQSNQFIDSKKEDNQNVIANNANMETINNDLKVNSSAQTIEHTNRKNNEKNIDSKNETKVNVKKIHEIKKQKDAEKHSPKAFEQDILTKKDKKEIKKAAKKEFKEKLKWAKKAEEEYNAAYNEEYRKYLRNLGYQVEEPWTLKRVITLILTIVVVIVIFAILWNIPAIRNVLTNLYNNNFIVKALVDLVKIIFETIIEFFK